jgi:hypothetical protein
MSERMEITAINIRAPSWAAGAPAFGETGRIEPGSKRWHWLVYERDVVTRLRIGDDWCGDRWPEIGPEMLLNDPCPWGST